MSACKVEHPLLHGLNDELTKSNYSHLMNESFNTLVIPPGFYVDKVNQVPVTQHCNIHKSG